MRVQVIQVNDVNGPPSCDAAVIVDVLRAFTVAPWCFASGADEVFLAPSVEAALAGRARWPYALLLKDGAPDDQFDLPNAPGMIAETALAGRVVIQETIAAAIAC